MPARFRCSDPLAGDFEFADVEEVLDALEAALVAPDTPMLDTVRQSWQPVAAHPEIRAAWVRRSSYRPPGGTGLELPALPAVAMVAAGADREADRRREAYARARALPVREPVQGEQEPPGRASGWTFVAALVGILGVLGLLGWGIVLLAGKLTGVAARAAGLEGGAP